MIPSWPLVIIHLGLLFAPAFRVTQETGSCVQVKPKFVNCTCFQETIYFFGKWLRYKIFAIFESIGTICVFAFRISVQDSSIKTNNACTKFTLVQENMKKVFFNVNGYIKANLGILKGEKRGKTKWSAIVRDTLKESVGW